MEKHMTNNPQDEYEIVIEAVVRKRIRVKANCEQEALEKAQESFSAVCDGTEEHYEERAY
jgi:hypothetical protein